jgi:hypothetical protein
MISSSQQVATMYTGALAGADNQRRHHPTHPAARASPLPRPTSERHPGTGLATGQPEAAAASVFTDVVLPLGEV